MATCKETGCDRTVSSRGWCSMHYNRWYYANRSPRPPCKIDGCDREQWARGYCSTCYQRWWKNGSAEKRLRAPAGSGHTTKRGYREITVNGVTVREHRYVMEQILGRPLLPGETVHHKNGNRSDNRPDNLELWVTSPRYGQRVKDVLAWAREVVDRYDGLLFIP